MKQGFCKVAAITPEIKVADPEYNAEQIMKRIDGAEQRGAKIMVFPELCLTGYTCGELFLQERLLEEALFQLGRIVDYTDGIDALIFIGLPIEKNGKLYNVAAVINCGELLAFIPKANIPAHGEFYEGRHFTPGNEVPVLYQYGEEEVPFGMNILFRTDAMKGLVVGAEICEDVWVAKNPAIEHALFGATVIVNLSASNETIGKDSYREMLIKSASAKLLCGYIYAGAGEGESTQDLVFGGHNIIAENGKILVQAKRFENETIIADLDIHRILHERRRMSTYPANGSHKPENMAEGDGYRMVDFEIVVEETALDRTFSRTPFVPNDPATKEKRCEEILSIQSYGLKKRYVHTQAKTAVVGVSGGLDSTLALLVVARAFDLLGKDRKEIVAVTMPCFGTTDRTYDNACRLVKALGTTLVEIDIKDSVTLHLKDIGHDINKHDVTYENGQARERTQVLMDLANSSDGLVIGTGDMSELALGWATYNGDHMSMYGVNAGVPKTLVRHLVQYYADTCGDEALKAVLLDVLDTPVSPELLPPADGQISQKTEDLVGPYELHDFFLYYMLRCGFEPAKIYRIAVQTFLGYYEEKVILKWLKTFYHRFFGQQFKRSCLPDGPKIGSVAVSPRGDLRMPSDASCRIWMKQLEELETYGSI